MAYLRIDKRRFEFLLRFGVDEEELRRFFIDNQKLLIMKGAKVQNLPRSTAVAINTMLNLPATTDSVVQKWFLAKITMINPETVDELIDTFRLYEDVGEEIPETDAKKFSRSCLVHLFSNDPSPKLIDFLKSPRGGNGEEIELDPEPEKVALPQKTQIAAELSLYNTGFASAIVALLEDENPDQYLFDLPPVVGKLFAGLYAIKEGHSIEADLVLEDLGQLVQIKPILLDYAERLKKKRATSRTSLQGIQIIRFEEVESLDFDFDRDQVLGKCTKDSPETAVFIQPFAIRRLDGRLVSLEKQATREAIFPSSGDIQAFFGKQYPRQPKRGEMGVWHIAPNELHGTSTYRNNFHIISAKTDVYEVQLAPYVSTEYDSVREFIKQKVSLPGKKQMEPLLFLLNDNLIVGCPLGRDLTRDDGFDEGLPCWSVLHAFRFEGRILVPGPLPVSGQYECGTLASTLKNFLSSKKTDSEKLTKTQLKSLVDSVNSGGARLNMTRLARLNEELKYIEDDDRAIAIFLDEAMRDEKIAARIEQSIQKQVDEQAGRKSALLKEIEQLEKQRDDLRENIAKQNKEQRALPSSVSKAIKESIKKAKEDVFGTLGQVVVFKSLMEEGGNSHNPISKFRSASHDATPLLDVLKALGLSSKHAKALEVTGDAVLNAGLILVIEGISARLAAEAWGRKNELGCMFMDCVIGLTDDAQLKGVAVGEAHPIVILDANLSPPDVYARPLIDHVQRRIINPEHTRSPWIVMSLSNGVASLPLPSSIEALAVHISLDQKPEFIREDDVVVKLEYVQDEEVSETWASRLWRPALNSLVESLKDMQTEDSALVLSVLSMPRSTG